MDHPVSRAFSTHPFIGTGAGNCYIGFAKSRLWSEHDQPSMLVIYDFGITSDTLIPTTVDIKIPKDGNITAVALKKMDLY